MAGSRFTIASACLCLLGACATARAETWEQQIELGREARKAQHLGDAEKHFKAALQEVRNVEGKEVQWAESLDGLASVYRDQNKYAKSEEFYKQSLKLKERALGPWNLSLAETLDNVAGVLGAEGKYDQAGPLYKRAHQIREQVMVEHPDVYVDGVRKPITPPK